MTWTGMARNLTLGALFVLPLSAGAGEPVNDFTLPSAKNNQRVSLSDHKGDVIFLSFWATWCGPCKVEMVHLQEMHHQLEGEPFTILSISSDNARDATKAKAYIRQKRYDFTVLLDTDSSVTGTYNPAKNLPYGVLIGKDHTVAKVYTGYNPGDEVRLLADVKEELAKPAP